MHVLSTYQLIFKFKVGGNNSASFKSSKSSNALETDVNNSLNIVTSEFATINNWGLAIGGGGGEGRRG